MRSLDNSVPLEKRPVSWWRRARDSCRSADTYRWHGGTVVVGSLVAASFIVGSAALLRQAPMSWGIPAAATCYTAGALLVSLVFRRRDGTIDRTLVGAAAFLGSVVFVPLLWTSPAIWAKEQLQSLGTNALMFTVLTAILAPRGGVAALFVAAILALASVLAMLI